MCYVNKDQAFSSCLEGWVSASKFGAIVFPETCICYIDRFCHFISVTFFSLELYNEFYRVTAQKTGRLVWSHGAARAAGGRFLHFQT